MSTGSKLQYITLTVSAYQSLCTTFAAECVLRCCHTCDSGCHVAVWASMWPPHRMAGVTDYAAYWAPGLAWLVPGVFSLVQMLLKAHMLVPS